ncbi:MAG: hypothetical protein ACO1G5_11670 [Bacteroidota bacterium]
MMKALATKVLLAGAVFYFGFIARLIRKNIAIKLNKSFTEIYIAIFF